MEPMPSSSHDPRRSAPHPPPRRLSASAAAARRREAEQLLALEPLERALLALDLGERCAAWAELAR